MSVGQGSLLRPSNHSAKAFDFMSMARREGRSASQPSQIIFQEPAGLTFPIVVLECLQFLSPSESSRREHRSGKSVAMVQVIWRRAEMQKFCATLDVQHAVTDCRD